VSLVVTPEGRPIRYEQLLRLFHDQFFRRFGIPHLTKAQRGLIQQLQFGGTALRLFHEVQIFQDHSDLAGEVARQGAGVRVKQHVLLPAHQRQETRLRGRRADGDIQHTLEVVTPGQRWHLS